MGLSNLDDEGRCQRCKVCAWVRRAEYDERLVLDTDGGIYDTVDTERVKGLTTVHCSICGHGPDGEWVEVL